MHLNKTEAKKRMIKSGCFFVFVVWVLATLLLGGCATVEQPARVFHHEPSQVLRGHTSLVKSVAWSPDGKRLVSAGLAPTGSDTVRMWNAVTGKQEWGLQAHVTEKFEGKSLPLATSVAWSPDGKRLATSGVETIRLWDATTGREERVLGGDAGEPLAATAVAWSPDGNYLASASSDGTVRVWNAINGEQVRVLRGHTAEVRSVSWSPDRSKLASCGVDKTVRLWNAVTGKEEQVLRGHTSFVGSVAWSPDGKRVASGGNDDTVRLWNAMTGEEERTLQANVSPGGPGSPFPGIVFSVAWNPDGKVLASGGADGTVRLLNVITGRVEQVLHGHYGEVLSVVWSPKGTRLASSDFNGTVMLWERELGAKGYANKPDF
jgi:FOG: WD40 repeat